MIPLTSFNSINQIIFEIKMEYIFRDERKGFLNILCSMDAKFVLSYKTMYYPTSYIWTPC
jgi:hypothetical protein